MDNLIAGGGVVASLLALKEVRQTIGRLVSGAADVPLAYLESLAETIRSDMAARKKVMSAVAGAARAVAKDDPALIERGLERWTRQLGVRQRAREKVAVRTLGVLAESGIPDGAAAPSEDFMRTFEDMAERVSSAELTDLLARILAGEIRKPGSVPRRVLAILPVLDREIVGALTESRAYLLNRAWVHVPPSAQGEWRQRFALLSSVSISSEVSPRTLPERDGFSVVRIEAKAVLMGVRPSKLGWFVDGAHLTPIGQDLVSLLPLTGEAKIEEIALGFKEHDFVERVAVGKVVEQADGAFQVIDAEEVVASSTAPGC